MQKINLGYFMYLIIILNSYLDLYMCKTKYFKNNVFQDKWQNFKEKDKFLVLEIIARNMFFLILLFYKTNIDHLMYFKKTSFYFKKFILNLFQKELYQKSNFMKKF